MAKISGNLSESARIIVVDESVWSVESNTQKPTGQFEITGLNSNKKMIIARAGSGKCLGYGNVTPV